jgi:hypothetical protein
MSERTVEAGSAVAHSIYAPIDRWTESAALEAMFEKPQMAEVVRINIEAASLDSTSKARSLDGPLLAELGRCHRDGTERRINCTCMPLQLRMRVCTCRHCPSVA